MQPSVTAQIILKAALALAAASIFTLGLNAATPEPLPRPDYLKLVSEYADAMIQKGRDRYGAEHSPLFASALNRETMEIGPFPSIPGVRETDRSLVGSNPQTEYGLYSILYALDPLTGKSVYAAEADKALQFFFTHCQSPKTGLMTWGEHLYWDFNRESMGGQDANHEICGEWPFWDACYRLAPDASWKFAMGQWDHQIFDQKTGNFSRHAKWSEHGPQKNSDFPRYAGQMIACWADAYTRKENKDREDRSKLLTAIGVLVARMESNMTKTPTGYLIAGTDNPDISWPESNLKLARCLWQSAPLMETELAQRMKKLAVQQDVHFLGQPHTIASGGGFVSCVDTNTGKPRSRSMNKPYTMTWSTGYGYENHATMANTCYGRFRQIEKEPRELAAKYKSLILTAADLYLKSEPDREQLLNPGAIASVIELLLNAQELGGEKKYLDRADHFGRLGVELFLGDGLPLPKATNKHSHYEAITGGPDFMQMLLELHKRLK